MKTARNTTGALFAFAVFMVFLAAPLFAEELYVSSIFLPVGKFTTSIEGPACAADGNLYAVAFTRKGTIAIVSPAGALLREVKLFGKSPSNIAFGGPDGRTCYVTMANDGSIETFRTDSPGRSWKLFQDRRTAVAAELNLPPKAFTLTGNYPNPFNTATTIEYTLGADTVVELAVYNLIGQQIAVLKEGQEHAGNHVVTWNAGGVSSGTYVVRLAAGGKAETRR